MGTDLLNLNSVSITSGHKWNRKLGFPTRILVDLLNKPLALGSTNFRIVWSSRYFFIVENTPMAASWVEKIENNETIEYCREKECDS